MEPAFEVDDGFARFLSLQFGQFENLAARIEVKEMPDRFVHCNPFQFQLQVGDHDTFLLHFPSKAVPVVQPRHQPFLFSHSCANALLADDESFMLQFVRRLADGVPRDPKPVSHFHFFWQKGSLAELFHPDEFAKVLLHLYVQGELAFMVYQSFVLLECSDM